MSTFGRIIKESSFLTNLRNERATLTNYLVNGRIADFAEYRYVVGQLHGMQKVIDLLENVKYEEEA
jgi:sRNA-binding regulator protein Hfq